MSALPTTTTYSDRADRDEMADPELGRRVRGLVASLLVGDEEDDLETMTQVATYALAVLLDADADAGGRDQAAQASLVSAVAIRLGLDVA